MHGLKLFHELELGANKTGRLNQLCGEKSFFFWQYPAVMAHVNTLVSTLLRKLVQQLGVIVPHASKGIGRLPAEVTPLIVGKVQGGDGHGSAIALDSRRIQGFVRLSYHHGGECGGIKLVPIEARWGILL